LPTTSSARPVSPRGRALPPSGRLSPRIGRPTYPLDGQPLVRPVGLRSPRAARPTSGSWSRSRRPGERTADTEGVVQPTGPASPFGPRRRSGGSPRRTSGCRDAGRGGSSRGYTAAIVPAALIAFDFDPLARIGDTAVRWETIGIAAAIFAALVVG